MAKVFFRCNPTSLVWEYGSFKEDGITPNVEYTAPAGMYRGRWQTVDSTVCLTIINSNNNGELDPIRNMPITYIASDLIGTPYANRAAFETANKDFFFRVGGSGSGGSSFEETSAVGVLNQTAFTIPKKISLTGVYFAIVDSLTVYKGKGLTITNNASTATATFTIAPEAGASIDFIYSPF